MDFSSSWTWLLIAVVCLVAGGLWIKWVCSSLNSAIVNNPAFTELLQKGAEAQQKEMAAELRRQAAEASKLADELERGSN